MHLQSAARLALAMIVVDPIKIDSTHKLFHPIFISIKKELPAQKLAVAPKSQQCISQIRTIRRCTKGTAKNIRWTIQITETVSVGQLFWSWNWQRTNGDKSNNLVTVLRFRGLGI